MKRLHDSAVRALLAAAAVLTLAPLSWAVVGSLGPEGHPWAPYGAALQAAPLARYALNSTMVAVAVAVCQTAFGALAAYAFARLHFRGRDLLFLLFLGTLLLPTHATLLPVFLLIQALDLVDTFAGLIAPSLVHPFSIFLIRQSLLELSTEMEDAARIDGCSPCGIFRYVALPFARPALVAASLFSFLWSWNSFSWPLIVMQSSQHYTLPVGIAMLSGELGSDWASMLAGGVMAAAPLVFMFFVVQRRFVGATEAAGTPSI